jgi:monofunctional biosynthetic peptidoglycan transglycosylase
VARAKYSKRFGGSSSRFSRFWRWPVAALAFGYVYLTAVYLTLPDVRPLAATRPETTAFIELRAREARKEWRTAERIQRWVSYDDISPNLKRAVLTAEDSAFFDHDGFDYDELRTSMEMWKKGDFSRGASTITQQLAKNLYLSPSRNPARKFRELLITRLLEGALTKRRILELYLNVVEWGDGVYGAEAAARRYFRTSAAGLSAEQAALLAGSLINPRRYSPGAPPRRLRQRQAIILRRMRGGGGAFASVGSRPAAPARVVEPVEQTPAELDELDEDPDAEPAETDDAPAPDSTEPAAPRPPTKDPS